MDILFELHAHSHKLNIYLHILCGSVAIILGTVQLLRTKGGRAHRRTGITFMVFFGAVIATALIGILYFNFRAFLGVLTLASGYSCFSGYRAIVLKGRAPRALDNTVAFTCIGLCLGFIATLELSLHSAPKVTIYATMSTLLLMCVYDVLRNLISVNWLSRVWLNEHIVKIISAFIGLVSAATGNLWPSYGAISQLGPSVLGFILVALFLQRSKKIRALA